MRNLTAPPLVDTTRLVITPYALGKATRRYAKGSLVAAEMR
jgi:hypothetical protein